MFDVQGVILAALLGIVAFMLRHYFLRIERHLKLNHEVVYTLYQHDLRLTLLERHVFGKETVLTAVGETRVESGE